MAILVFLNISNWRYYYFAHLACYFLLPLIVTDCVAGRRGMAAAMLDAGRADAQNPLACPEKVNVMVKCDPVNFRPRDRRCVSA
jgi:hypothetical protein